MTPQEEDDYKKKLAHLALEISSHPEQFMVADKIVRRLVPDHPENHVIYTLAKNACKISVAKMHAAMEKFKKELDRQAKAFEEAMAAKAALGGDPQDERQYMELFIKQRGLTMAFNGQFRDASGENVSLTSVRTDSLLTAAAMGYTPPRGSRMSTSAIKLAFDEWRAVAKEAKRLELWYTINHLSDERDADLIMRAFREVCQHYFALPDFAMAAVLKFIWQVKRKMLGLPIVDHHMLVIQGPQKTGKTEFLRMLINPVKDISAETSIDQLLDDAASSLKQFFVINLDEMVRADKADVAKLKTIITARDYTTRVFYSHDMECTKVNTTVAGNCNEKLGSKVFDQTGMRRFVEVEPLPLDQVRPWWQSIVDFDWLGLWQVVDPNAPDPIMSGFRDQLLDQQEEMRAKSTVEHWVDDFDMKDTTHIERVITQASASFFAKSLYTVFLDHEKRFFPGNYPTNITKWGTEFKALIANGFARNWGHTTRKGAKTTYHLRLDNVVPLRPDIKMEG